MHFRETLHVSAQKLVEKYIFFLQDKQNSRRTYAEPVCVHWKLPTLTWPRWEAVGNRVRDSREQNDVIPYDSGWKSSVQAVILTKGWAMSQNRKNKCISEHVCIWTKELILLVLITLSQGMKSIKLHLIFFQNTSIYRALSYCKGAA